MIETSIIIPVRNQKKSLLAAMFALKRQIKKPRTFELVICDDGSTDGTDQAIRKLKYPLFFKYFRNDPPLGRSANRNSGFDRSAGEHLIFFDGDMVPVDGYITAMLADIKSDTVKLGSAQAPPDEKQGRLERYLYSRGRYDHMGEDVSLPGRLFTSNNFLISRENFKKVGGFDIEFKGWGGEDIDFGLKLEDLGVKLKNVPEAITYHYHERAIKTLADDFYNFGEKSFAYLIKKHPRFLDQIPGHLLGISGGFFPARLIFKLVSWFTINSAALKFAEKLVDSAPDYNWPDFVFDYIFWGNLGLGYKKRSE
ncbi:MAG: glycosyltransferase [candidate division Zixibacteria bacterium]|nr:glycosyltransferase [candidate division Zixibacteria bacterium]